MIKLVACDFDDTLVCERMFVESGFSACSAELEKSGLSGAISKKVFWEEFEKSHANVFDRAIERLFGKPDADLSEKLVEIYRYHTPAISYAPDVPEFLSQARKRNLKTAIVTDGDSKTQHNKLSAVRAEKDFDKVVATADFGADFKKPSPKAFIFLRDFFGVNFEEILYIGDNPHKDFAMSAAIPITTVRIRRKGMIHDYPDYRDGIREHFSVSTLPEIFGLPIFK